VERIARLAFEAVDDIESRISSWKSDSQTARINNRAAAEPVPVAADVIELLEASKAIHKATDGAFDVTVGPLSRLYGLYEGEGRAPSDAEIAAALKVVGADKIRIDKRDQTVSFKKAGMELDFGGIGKGFALDRAAEIMREHGVRSALLHGGKSTVLAIGAPPGRTGWTVDIRHPYNAQDAIERVEIRDASVSTSGCYGEMLTADGQSVCNILDPRTGRPVETMLSATAICATATESDALSTAFLVMGPEDVEKYCRRHREVSAVVVVRPEEGEPVARWIGDRTR
jgi:thiamine biosynthesis lipoprotein